AYAINQGSGTNNTTLGCHTLSSQSHSADPRGHLDAIQVSGGLVRFWGWTGDPDAPELPASGPQYPRTEAVDPSYPGPYLPTTIELHVDGRPFYSGGFYGTAERPDVQRAFPDMPNARGFDRAYPILPGRHSFCLYAINRGRAGNNNTTLGCYTTDVPGVVTSSADPRGALDAVRRVQNQNPGDAYDLLVTGWAWDPQSSPVTVRARFLWTAGASRPDTGGFAGQTGVRRDDVQRAFAAAPADTGYELRYAVRSGSSSSPMSFIYLCTYAARGEVEWLLGCKSGAEFT
ncbi:MAG: hypothetical protein LC792_25835, partial [Actinobacteria bacterium]|nr:hypothetical protein [Actinomycetota bacterium]